jgi:putative restriction endonuclease
MLVDDLTDPDAVGNAAKEYRELGGEAFRRKYGFGPSQRYWLLLDGQLYDAKAIVGAAFGYQHPGRGSLRNDQFDGGEGQTNPALRRLGFTVLSSQATNADEERRWRLTVAEHLERQKSSAGYVSPGALREQGAYGGGQGVWVDAARTKELGPNGAAVGILSTGLHYADDIGDDGLIYHFPSTSRAGRRDESEVNALKRAAELKLPIFMISDPRPKSALREFRLAYVDGWDDNARIFSLTFGSTAPAKIQDHDDSDDRPFSIFGSKSTTKLRPVRHRPGQHKFKLAVIQRYGARCALSGVTVPEMLEAAHLVPDAGDGTDDPRNGLLLNAALHRAFDAGLFAINATTFAVEVQPGLTLADLGIQVETIADLSSKPHIDALTWRHAWWLSRPKNV